MPSSQALPGFLITAPPSVLVPAVLGGLAVWMQNPKKKGPHKPLVVNVVVVSPFEEEEEGTGIASDIFKVEGEYPATPVYYLRSFDTRKPRDRNDSPISD